MGIKVTSSRCSLGEPVSHSSHTQTHTTGAFPRAPTATAAPVCVAPLMPNKRYNPRHGAVETLSSRCVYIYGVYACFPYPLRYSARICLLSAMRMCIITPGTTRVQWNMEQRDSLTHFIYSLLAPSCQSCMILKLAVSLKSNFL